MALTAATVSKAILQKLVVQDVEAPLTPSEFQDTILAMNNYMFGLAADGINLGYTEVSNLGDLITVPSGALRGMIANIAIDISPDYDVQPSGALVASATQGLKSMRRLGQRIGQAQFPGTLPIGSGNGGGGSFDLGHFYPELEQQILAEVSGPIGLESETEEAT